MLEHLQTLTLALIPVFLALDFIVQKRKYNKTRHWRLHGLLVTMAILWSRGQRN